MLLKELNEKEAQAFLKLATEFISVDGNIDVKEKQIIDRYSKALNITNADSSEFSIYDLSGKQISNGKISDNTVSVNALPKGVYLIKVGNVSKKFIKE